MAQLDTKYRLAVPVTNSGIYSDASLSFTARGIVVTMSHKESARDGGIPTTLRDLLNPVDEPEDLANALAELVRAGIIAEVQA